MLPQGSQASFKAARATSGLLSSCCSGIRLHLELRQETQGSSPVATGISGWLQSFNRGVWPCIVLEAWNSAFISSCKCGLKPPV